MNENHKKFLGELNQLIKKHKVTIKIRESDMEEMVIEDVKGRETNYLVNVVGTINYQTVITNLY